MALQEKNLEVKTSTIPNAGKGLFAKILIPKNTRIIEYLGKVTTWKEVEYNFENAYIYYVNRNHVIDAGNDKKILARYANDAAGLTKVKGINNNATYKNEAGHVFLIAAKDIKAGAEILVPYGKEYWNVVRANMKIDADTKLTK